MNDQGRRAAWAAAAVICWIATVGSGFVALERHRARPGDAGAPPRAWPSDSRIVPGPGRSNLVVAAHPSCPCTRATIAELSRLMARCRGEVAAHVLFLEPTGAEGPAEPTGLWRAAEAIPGVRVSADPSGEEARRFGAATSGHALLFDPGGALRYSGGLTGSRGHEGGNPGRDAVMALATGGRSDRSRMPVFGCPLFDLTDTRPGAR